MIAGSAGSPTVATAVSPVADASVYVVTWAFVSRIKCNVIPAVMACWGVVPPRSTSLCPLMVQGHSILPGMSFHDLTELGSSFIGLWAIER